jgi:hypothetical protein
VTDETAIFVTIVLIAPQPARLTQFRITHKAIAHRKLMARAKLGLRGNLVFRFFGRLLAARYENDARTGCDGNEQKNTSFLHGFTP